MRGLAGLTNLCFLKSLGGHEFDPFTVTGEPRTRVSSYVRLPSLSGAHGISLAKLSTRDNVQQSSGSVQVRAWGHLHIQDSYDKIYAHPNQHLETSVHFPKACDPNKYK